MRLAKKNDSLRITSLFTENKDSFSVKDEYSQYDMPIKAFNVEFAKDFRTYLGTKLKSKNSVNIHLRSLHAILNDAEKTYEELKGHKPLDGIQKDQYGKCSYCINK